MVPFLSVDEELSTESSSGDDISSASEEAVEGACTTHSHEHC